MSATTILLYGRTGSGKSSQIGVLAEYVYKTLGKKTRLYTADRGGVDPVQPYISLGIIEPVELAESDPWIFVNRAAKGHIRDANRKWVLDKAKNAEIGLYAFESAHSIAKLMKLDIERKAAIGINIGGDTNTTFEVSGDGEKLKIGTTKGYQKYAIPQTRISEEIMESQKLPADYVLWTAGASKDDDDINTTKVVGPDILGKALTTTIPQDFNYTFRMDVISAQQGKPERHILYLGNHVDISMGNASALGNIRRPLDAPPLQQLTIEPADIGKALDMVRFEAQKAAVEVIRRRLALKVT